MNNKKYIEEYIKLRELLALKNKYSVNGSSDIYSEKFNEVMDLDIKKQKQVLDSLIKGE